MKFIWEEKDIEPGWRVLDKANDEYIIGFRYNPDCRSPFTITLVDLEDGQEEAHFNLIVVSNGKPPGNTAYEETTITAAKQMADFLNEQGYRPKTITRFG